MFCAFEYYKLVKLAKIHGSPNAQGFSEEHVDDAGGEVGQTRFRELVQGKTYSFDPSAALCLG